MDIDDFETLFNKCQLSINKSGTIFIEPKLDKDIPLIQQIIKKNKLENMSLSDLNSYMKQHREKQQEKIKQFFSMNPQQITSLPTKEKIEYLDILFSRFFPENQRIELLSHNKENIKACLFNLKFSKDFWNNEKKYADRFVSLIALQSGITNKIKDWQHTTLEDKKLVIQQSAQICKYIYGLNTDIVYFTPEEEKARLKALGFKDDTHINAAYFSEGKIYFNEERLQNSDNFFAISVLFHEYTHARQDYTNFNDELDDRILKSNIACIAYYENRINDKESMEYKDFYTMLPSEIHAHGLQQYIEHQLIEKTGIEKNNFTELNKETKQIHNKAFSIAAISQYHSSQK